MSTPQTNFIGVYISGTQARAAVVNSEGSLIQSIVAEVTPKQWIPQLAAMVEGMKPGALIVDLAAESGGNCELTKPGERIEHGGVVILGPLNLPAGAPLHASEMYARNVFNFVELLVRDGELKPDFDDELVAKSCLSHAGEKRFAG